MSKSKLSIKINDTKRSFFKLIPTPKKNFPPHSVQRRLQNLLSCWTECGGKVLEGGGFGRRELLSRSSTPSKVFNFPQKSVFMLDGAWWESFLKEGGFGRGRTSFQRSSPPPEVFPTSSPRNFSH